MRTQHRLLVVDDEASLREVLEIVFENSGYEVRMAADVKAAVEALEEEEFDAVLTDLAMGGDRNAGMQLLTWLQEHAKKTPAIMMTAHGSLEKAVEAMRRGADDFIVKPFHNEEIRERVKKAIQSRDRLREIEALRQQQARIGDIENFIGTSAAFQSVLTMVRRVATLPSTVAIHGESGAGKELVARALHQLSNRAAKPFVAINCGGIPETLLESELFGYKKGAFTGAVEDKEGLFVVANGGTIFLDEIGEMPLMLQVKLLRVLDNSTVTPVGGTNAIKVDVRIISATNRDLKQMAEEGTFRKDLYYRLNVIPLTVPPLRDRIEDIPLLARHFSRKHAEKMGRDRLEISPAAMVAMEAYPWPGNVRELGNVMERVMALCNGTRVEVSDLPDQLQHLELGYFELPEGQALLPPGGLDLEKHVADLEKSLINQALVRGKHSHIRAAQLLGLKNARVLRHRLQKYGMDEGE